ncbi:MAG: cytochrome B [Pseudonocardiales bacterium]|nr:MAG: cytochrome B [Pseudonocardiales bacterium]
MAGIVSASARCRSGGHVTGVTHPPPRRDSPLATGHNALVTSTATVPSFESSKVHSLTRPNIVSVGTIVWLSSELMFFAGLFAMYFTVRSVHPGDWPMTLPDGADIKLSLAYATPFTVILVASSFTCQWGVFAAEKGDVFKLRRWFTITFIMGLAFVLGQANEYRIQVSEGNTISATGYGSVFYLTTGFHGLHVIGGLIAFVLFLIRTALGRFTPAQATAAIVVSYYWHFVDVVWIGLFAMIYIIR